MREYLNTCARWVPRVAKPKVVAVIDDDLGVGGAISRLLLPLGYDTELYASAKEFLDAAMMTEAICLIVDIEPGESCGSEFAHRLVNVGFTTPIIVRTADANESYKRRPWKWAASLFP